MSFQTWWESSSRREPPWGTPLVAPCSGKSALLATNVISGNGDDGVVLEGANSNDVSDNIIGLDETGERSMIGDFE